MADNDAALGQNIFNIAQAQAETEVQPHRIFDDLWRETMAFEVWEILAFGHDEHLRSR